MVLQRHHDDVVQLEIVGQRDDRAVPRLERDRLVVAGPVADVFDPGLAQMIDRLEGLRQAGTEPAARPPAGELLDDVERPRDCGALVLDLVHRLLVVAVRVELPAAVEACPDGARIGLAGPGIERDRRPHAEPVEHLANAPESDAHAVFVPAPVRMIGQLRLPLRRRDHHPAIGRAMSQCSSANTGQMTRRIAVRESKRRPLRNSRERQPLGGQHALLRCLAGHGSDSP